MPSELKKKTESEKLRNMTYRTIQYPLTVLVIAIGLFVIIGIVGSLHESLHHLGWYAIAVLLYSILITPISLIVGLVLDLIKGPKEKNDT